MTSETLVVVATILTRMTIFSMTVLNDGSESYRSAKL